MKRIAALSAALVLASAAGLAQAQQVSSDDFSVVVGPNAHYSVSTAPASRVPAQLVSGVELEQGLVGPQAARPVSKVTRAQVIREREMARAQGDLVPGAENLNVVGAPVTHHATIAPVGLPAGE